MLKKDTEGVIWLLSLPLQKLSDFLDAVKKAYPGDIERGGTALIKFLVYVLRVNYGKSERIMPWIFVCRHYLFQEANPWVINGGYCAYNPYSVENLRWL